MKRKIFTVLAYTLLVVVVLFMSQCESRVKLTTPKKDAKHIIAMAEAIERARSGEGPTILELKTYRKYGHSRNDACGYRPKEEEKEWLEDRDPIKTFRARLLEEGVATEEEIEKIEEEVDAAIDDSVEFAKNSPLPSLESALEDIYAD